MRTFALMLSVAALPLATPAAAVTSILVPATLTTTTYTQNFNMLAAAGESNVLPVGFQIAETGGSTATVDGNYTGGTGSDNAGDVYSFGTTPADRALGTVLSGTNSPSFGAVFNNGLTSAITALTFSFAGEQWRSVAGAPTDRLDFQYRLAGGAIDTGSWIDLNALDILSLVNLTTGAVDGNVAANRALYTGTISNLNIAAGQSFAFRFVDFDVAGSDTGLALDDLTLTATTNAVAAVPEPATWGMLLLGFGSMGYAMRRRSNGARIRFA